jgi:hypothetical protein
LNTGALFELGEKWLDDYQDFNQKDIEKSPYYIGNPNIYRECWVK